jgi:hypothetical protein
MTLYNLYAGMSGGFGGANFERQEEFESQEEAYNAAYEAAVEDYQSYEGYYGILSQNEIQKEHLEEYGEEPSDEELQELYADAIEGWIEYWAVEADNDPNWDYEEGRSNL